MPRVELIYDSDCPNAAAARSLLLRAFSETGLQANWQEWQSDAEDSPAHLRRHASPTILVEGRDVEAAEDIAGASCRLYQHPDGSMAGVPTLEAVASALRAAPEAHPGDAGDVPAGKPPGWTLGFAALPGIGAALLPKVACPACWPAYAGFLSSVGLGFLVETAYLFPLTAAFLAIAVFALAFRARKRRGYRPFALGVTGSAIVLIGKFYFESDPAMYAGLALLIASSIWNSWPKKASTRRCPSCVGGAQPTTQTQ